MMQSKSQKTENTELSKTGNDSYQSMEDLKLDSIQKGSSFKTNFFISEKNFQTIMRWVNRLRDYVDELYNMINIPAIIAELVKYYEANKNMLTIRCDMEIGFIDHQTVNKRDFDIKRIDEYVIEITCSSEVDWDVDRLIIQVKNIDGMIVYPRLITKTSKITIDFIDGMITNYFVFFF
jgi:hypothetical protein